MEKKMIYDIKSKSNLADSFQSSFSIASFNKAINQDSTKAFVASHLAQLLRNDDLENHMVYYRTQTLGKFMTDQVEKMKFDTIRLRPVLNKLLIGRGINVPFKFLTRSNDSTFHQNNFPDSLLKQYPIITRSIPTYSAREGQHYVRLMFSDPFYHILSNMQLMLCSAILLILTMAICFYILLKKIYQEKKLGAMKNDFISNITHEFKTPLATATVAIEAIQNELQGELQDELQENATEKTSRYLQHAWHELDHLNLLTDKILKLAIYENEEQVLRKTNLLLSPLIADITSAYQFNQNNIKFNIHNESGIEELKADEIQFRHALANVIDNAIKYGGSQVDITLYLISDNKEHLLITIRDYGSGIEEHNLPHIFDKFYRVNHQSIKGYGLGLHYVQQILKLHKGWCKAFNSKPGLSIQLAWPI